MHQDSDVEVSRQGSLSKSEYGSPNDLDSGRSLLQLCHSLFRLLTQKALSQLCRETSDGTLRNSCTNNQSIITSKGSAPNSPSPCRSVIHMTPQSSPSRPSVRSTVASPASLQGARSKESNQKRAVFISMQSRELDVHRLQRLFPELHQKVVRKSESEDQYVGVEGMRDRGGGSSQVSLAGDAVNLDADCNFELDISIYDLWLACIKVAT